VVQTGAGLAAVMLAAAGSFSQLGALVGTMGAANVMARAMTNPNFVKWLATTTRQPVGAYTSSVANLTQIANKTGDEELEAIATYLAENKPNNPSQNSEGRE